MSQKRKNDRELKKEQKRQNLVSIIDQDVNNNNNVSNKNKMKRYVKSSQERNIEYISIDDDNTITKQLDNRSQREQEDQTFICIGNIKITSHEITFIKNHTKIAIITRDLKTLQPFHDKIMIKELWLTDIINDCYFVMLRKENPKIFC